MPNRRRLTTDEFQGRLRNLTDALYEEFVVPNPYVNPVHRTYNEYSQLVDALIESNFDFSYYPSRSGQNSAVQPAICATPAPPAVNTPLGLHPNFEHAVRCASNTLATGNRCNRASFLPFTLCSVHFRYWKTHKFLPPGGASAPGIPHPTDLWHPPVPPQP